MNPILDDPLVAGITHVEIIDAVGPHRGDAGGMGEAATLTVVPGGRTASTRGMVIAPGRPRSDAFRPAETILTCYPGEARVSSRQAIAPRQPVYAAVVFDPS
jgi:hypothetical protein